MADLEENFSELEELKQRHRKEKKGLQAEITKLKHSVSKGEKKKWKETKDKIAVLEAELKERHERELAEFEQNEAQTDTKETDVAGQIDQLNIGETEGVVEPEGEDKEDNQKGVKQKKSKAQKRREKKAAESRDREERIKQQEIDNLTSSRHLESVNIKALLAKPLPKQDLEKKAAENRDREERIKQQEIDNLTSSRHLESVNIKALLAKRGLQIFEIPSDGNCLYAAVNHQLGQRQVTSSVDSLRKQVSDFMRLNKDDFLPFLTKDNGDCFTSDDFEDYCVQLEKTPAWGGQLEIQALSSILKVPIEVVQSEGPPLISGNEFSQPPLILTYYRHAYGLGEHYHSVQTLKQEDTDDFT